MNSLINRILANRDIQDFLVLNIGEESPRIIKAANASMTDDALAMKCKLKVSEIRSTLNKLHNFRLAEYTRIKDKTTGWFSYYWRININRLLEVLENNMKGEISSLEKRLDESTTIFSFNCPKCSKENKIDFDTAMELSFKCPQCNKALRKVKSGKKEIIGELNSIRKRYSDFKNDIIELNEVIERYESLKNDLDKKNGRLPNLIEDIIEKAEVKKAHKIKKVKNRAVGKVKNSKLKRSKSRNARIKLNKGKRKSKTKK